MRRDWFRVFRWRGSRCRRYSFVGDNNKKSKGVSDDNSVVKVSGGRRGEQSVNGSAVKVGVVSFAPRGLLKFPRRTTTPSHSDSLSRSFDDAVAVTRRRK